MTQDDVLNVKIPPGLDEATIHDGNCTGVVADRFLIVHSDTTQTGGIYPMRAEQPRWTLVHPITKEAFVEVCAQLTMEQLETATSDMIDAVRH